MQEKALEERYRLTPEHRKRLVNVISFDGGGMKGLILLQVGGNSFFVGFMLFKFFVC